MAIPSILPSSEILQKVEGVERALRARRRIGMAGLVLAAVQTTFLAWNSEWIGDVLSFDWHALGTERGIALAATFLFVLGWLVVLWARFYLRESTTSFRYTYSVGAFDPVGETKPVSPLPYLPFDLSERLSQRIGRLSQRVPAEDNSLDDGAKKDDSSHIHIRGYYSVRPKSDAVKSTLEVTPWVSIGSARSPERLARPISWPHEGRYVTESDYRQLVEAVYFSVATEIYRQLRIDVSRKIRLLPSRYFRATAYLHEAEDYASSNTLDAYAEATDLYEEALRLFDPRARPRPDGLLRRPWHRARGELTRVAACLRIVGSKVIPRLGRGHVMAAKAETGLARMLLARRHLAGLYGSPLNPVFEARPLASNAIARLRFLNDDVPGREDARFDAWVTLAEAWDILGSPGRARDALSAAHRVSPRKANRDAAFALVRGLTAQVVDTGELRLRRATEIDPTSEIARFLLAFYVELIWRWRHSLARGGVDRVLREYQEVLRLNPGNIAARANRGYVYWLVGDLDSAEKEFKLGRDYKTIKRDTYVAELDYGLARVYAEQGKFEEAAKFFADAVAAILASGLGVRETARTGYYFDLVDQSLWQRYKRYRDSVEELAQNMLGSPAVKTVQAYVANDYGEACEALADRLGDRGKSEESLLAYRRAIEVDPACLMAQYNLARKSARREDEERVIRLAPEWVEARLFQLRHHMDDAIEHYRRFLELRALDRRATFRPLLRFLRVANLQVAREPAETTAANELDDAMAARERARIELCRLLPHGWLWRRDVRGDQLSRRMLNHRGLRRERAWERALTDLHAEVLAQWAFILAGTSRKIANWMNTRGKRRWLPSRDISTLALRHVEQHFKPDDYQIMTAMHIRTKRARRGVDICTRVRRLLKDHIRRDPINASSLELHLLSAMQRGMAGEIVEKPVFSLDERRRLLDAALAATPDGDLPFGSIQVVLHGFLQLNREATAFLSQDLRFESWRNVLIGMQRRPDRLEALTALAPNAGALWEFRRLTARSGWRAVWVKGRDQEFAIKTTWEDTVRRLTHGGETALEGLHVQIQRAIAQAECVGTSAELLELAQTLEATEEWEHAFRFAELARARLDEHQGPSLGDACAVTVGRAAWALGRSEAALAAFKSLTSQCTGLPATWRLETIEALVRTRVPTREELPVLQAWLRRDQTLASSREGRRDAGAALLALADALGHGSAVSGPSSRIVVEVGVHGRQKEKEMPGHFAAALAKEVEAITGITGQYPVISETNDLSRSDYRVRIDGLIAGSGSFVPDDDAHPVERAVASLAGALNAHAARFVTTDDVIASLARLPGVADATAVSEPEEVVMFVELLRELLRDRVRVGGSLADIWAAWNVARSRGGEAIREEIRFAIRGSLPGNEATAFRLLVDPKIEQALIERSRDGDDGVRVARRLVAWLREQRAQWGLGDEQTGKPLALVVRSSDARPRLAALVRRYGLHTPVLSEREVVDRRSIVEDEPISVTHEGVG